MKFSPCYGLWLSVCNWQGHMIIFRLILSRLIDKVKKKIDLCSWKLRSTLSIRLKRKRYWSNTCYSYQGSNHSSLSDPERLNTLNTFFTHLVSTGQNASHERENERTHHIKRFECGRNENIRGSRFTPIKTRRSRYHTPHSTRCTKFRQFNTEWLRGRNH